MSGGWFDYEDREFALDLFENSCPDRGETFNVSAQHRKDGPFEDDPVLNELVWDVFCLFHEYDWYRTGDTNEDTWQKARNTFANKWFKKDTREEYIKKLLNEHFDELRKYFDDTFGVDKNA